MNPVVLQANDCSGLRLDSFLGRELPELTRSAAQRLIEDGRVTVDGKTVSKSAKLSGGETVAVELPEPETANAAAQNIPLDVVYEDADVIVVNKPAGMVVHPAPGHPDGTLVNALLFHCGDSLSGIGGALRPGIVHRIDRDTSGLIIAAKNDAAHQSLAAQLQDHSLARTYEAIVVGGLREDAGTVDAPIGRHFSDRKKMAVTQKGRPAVTHWEVLERFPGRHRLRRKKTRAGSHRPVPPGRGPAVCTPHNRGTCGTELSSGRGISKNAAKTAESVKTPQFYDYCLISIRTGRPRPSSSKMKS